MEQQDLNNEKERNGRLDTIAEMPPDGLLQLQEAAETPPRPPEFTGAPVQLIKTIRDSKGRNSKAKPRGNMKSTSIQPSPAPTARMAQNPTEVAAQGMQAVQEMGQDQGTQDPNIDPQLHQGHTGQKRSMYDAQSGAERLIFEEEEPSQIMSDPSQRIPGNAATTQDNGFQPEPHQQQRKRRPGRPRNSAVLPSDQSYQPTEDQEDEGPEYPQNRDSSPKLTGTPPPSNYALAQHEAKLITASLRKDKVPQKRKAWTSEECDALVDGIAHFGNSYALLKKDDEKSRKVFPDRNPEDLRHKARNMKFDYLKADMPLPPGFEKVLLDQKFKDKLKALGREYHQEQMRAPKRQKNNNNTNNDDSNRAETITLES